MTQIWLRWAVGLLIPVAFFFGAEYGKKDTAQGYRSLIGKMSPSCQASFERVVTREMPE